MVASIAAGASGGETQDDQPTRSSGIVAMRGYDDRSASAPSSPPFREASFRVLGGLVLRVAGRLAHRLAFRLACRLRFRAAFRAWWTGVTRRVLPTMFDPSFRLASIRVEECTAARTAPLLEEECLERCDGIDLAPA